MSRKKKWLIGIAAAATLGMFALVVAASILARRFEPYVREQAIEYLHKRFDSDVELASLRVHLPKAEIETENLVRQIADCLPAFFRFSTLPRPCSGGRHPESSVAN